MSIRPPSEALKSSLPMSIFATGGFIVTIHTSMDDKLFPEGDLLFILGDQIGNLDGRPFKFSQ
jgi:hypothetical protein